MRSRLSLVLLFASLFAVASNAAPKEKEWTVLTFLNGHNNLDSFGKLNINQMEKVGSTDDINVIVQWASTGNDDTRRLYVTQDNDSTAIKSEVIESLPRVDMGDYKNLVEFVKWGVKNYPAKHYFVNVWNHGSGWHRSGEVIRNISLDDYTGHYITTKELGMAMQQSADIIGHKVDIYGSDACLMQMAEVNGEMYDAVDVVVNSQEVEPGEGWPYDKWLAEWATRPSSTPAQVAAILTQKYVESTPRGATLSSVDLAEQAKLDKAVAGLADAIAKLNASDMAALKTKLAKVQRFYYSDYADLMHLVKLASDTKVGALAEGLDNVKSVLNKAILSNHASNTFTGANGLSIWLPTSKSTLSTYAAKYKDLKFAAASNWQKALEAMLK